MSDSVGKKNYNRQNIRGHGRTIERCPTKLFMDTSGSRSCKLIRCGYCGIAGVSHAVYSRLFQVYTLVKIIWNNTCWWPIAVQFWSLRLNPAASYVRSRLLSVFKSVCMCVQMALALLDVESVCAQSRKCEGHCGRGPWVPRWLWRSRMWRCMKRSRGKRWEEAGGGQRRTRPCWNLETLTWQVGNDLRITKMIPASTEICSWIKKTFAREEKEGRRKERKKRNKEGKWDETKQVRKQVNKKNRKQAGKRKERRDKFYQLLISVCTYHMSQVVSSLWGEKLSLQGRRCALPRPLQFFRFIASHHFTCTWSHTCAFTPHQLDNMFQVHQIFLFTCTHA